MLAPTSHIQYLAVLAPSAVVADATPSNHRARPSSASSLSNDHFDSPTAYLGIFSAESPNAGRRALRKPSPGLLARVRLLSHRSKNRTVSSPALGVDIGRIPEDHLRELDSRHRAHSIRVERRGQAWNRTHPRLEPQLTGGSMPELVMDGQTELESDHSSIISTSDRMGPSDTESELDGAEHDTLKYRLPDVGKVAGDLRNSSRPDLEQEPEEEPSRPPTPPPKDTPPMLTSPRRDGTFSQGISTDDEAYFNPYGASRTNSIYSLSRASFTNQLSQLTSIRLPQASSLSESIASIPTSTAAARALEDAAEQIRIWMNKASEVLDGLDAEDDIEWAAAGGREGLDQVDAAINRFESLVTVYVVAIENLQARDDIASLTTEELERMVAHMEGIVQEWQNIKRALGAIKEQVEIAMEWEDIWNTVLGEIGLEIEALGRLVFEMEERRHQSAPLDSESGSGLDIGELERIVVESPKTEARVTANNRYSLPPALTLNSPIQSPTAKQVQEDSNLLQLFAKMQPLRASLDFLPMRLAHFGARGSAVFPTACEELDKRRDTLEARYKKLEDDAEALRRELSDDRWVHLFRNAGQKVSAMFDSLARSLSKLTEALEEDPHNLELLAKRIEYYTSKQPHYPPAIEQILSIIDKGAKERLSLNGEILRLQSDMQRRWADLKNDMAAMDAAIKHVDSPKNQQLRDSISTILTADHSANSSMVATPGSSPASSVVLMSRKSSEHGYGGLSKSRQSSSSVTGSAGSLPTPTGRRYSSMPSALPNLSLSGIPRKTAVSRSSASETTPQRAASQSPTTPRLPPLPPSSTPTPSHGYRTPPASAGSDTAQPPKPRWNPSTNTNDIVLGLATKPLPPVPSVTPSPHAKSVATPSTARNSIRSVSSVSGIPVSSPLSRNSPYSTPPPSALPRPTSITPQPSAVTAALSSANKHRQPLSPASPTASRLPSSAARPLSQIANPGLRLGTAGRRVSGIPLGSIAASVEEDGGGENSPAGRVAAGKAKMGRTSMGTGRESRGGGSGRVSSLGASPGAGEERPRWRI
ncbi:hypothetical protein W97_02980 [Coniosporium apollinis CBS 100218]|uniref:Karyogamy protein n=1 Tax=Coniosporium apollinis (strain CBS 100218) TaxID=1168221 RepID=R7YPC9_CONA1|nr:uncharacterized protein W97_02980 [Coniosporium apollinis CBS 100218]EON63752.1 hypothetical protein W97_02980 [Coniosporium apollinis CBS 100218]